MNYILFDEHITLQALLKSVGILPSGGAAKAFLAEETVLLNGEPENRRGKKIRVGDVVELPNLQEQIAILAPNPADLATHQEDMAEKERVKQLVKELNKKEKTKPAPTGPAHSPQKDKRPVRFPGT